MPEYASLDYLPRLEQDTDRFAQLLAEGDLQAPVPPCPGWRLADLGAHLGQIHQWANHAVVAGNPDADPTSAPTDRAGLVEWYRDTADTLLSTLKSTDPARPTWGFGPRPRTVSFWYRRQAHETAIHLWDAAASQGATVDLDTRFAEDGIDEVASVFFPRQVRLGRIPALGRSLALSCVELDEAGPRFGVGSGRRWVLTGDGEGPASAAEADAQATVRGPAQTLLLLIWGRADLDHPNLMVDGDRDAAIAVLTAGVTP